MQHNEYHSRLAVSASLLKLLAAKTPAHVHHQYISSEAKLFKMTPAMRIGSLTHCLLLEPDEVNRRFYRKTRGSAEEKAEIEREGYEIVTPAEWDTAFGMADSVTKSPEASALLRGGRPEVSIFEDRDDDLLPMKCRIDYLLDNDGGIVELKTAADASPGGFQAAVYRMGYHLQMAFYMRMAGIGDPNRFIFVAVENKPPFPVGIYIPTVDVWRDGMTLMHQMLSRFDSCWANNDWPGYGCCSLFRPRWAGNGSDDEIPLGELDV